MLGVIRAHKVQHASKSSVYIKRPHQASLHQTTSFKSFVQTPWVCHWIFSPLMLISLLAVLYRLVLLMHINQMSNNKTSINLAFACRYQVLRVFYPKTGKKANFQKVFSVDLSFVMVIGLGLDFYETVKLRVHRFTAKTSLSQAWPHLSFSTKLVFVCQRPNHSGYSSDFWARFGYTSVLPTPKALFGASNFWTIWPLESVKLHLMLLDQESLVRILTITTRLSIILKGFSEIISLYSSCRSSTCQA